MRFFRRVVRRLMSTRSDDDDRKFQFVQQTFRSRLGNSGQGKATLVVASLIGANVGVYALMQTSPSAAQAIAAHAICTPRSFAEGRSETLLLSAFVHGSPMHLLVNMIGIASFAPAMIRLMGPAHWLGWYCAAAVASSAAFIAQQIHLKNNAKSPFERHQFMHHGVVGASGSVMASAALFALQYPTARFYLFAVIPMPTWILVPGLLAFDLYQLNNTRDRVSHASHLGGGAVGVLAFFVERRFRPHLFRRPFRT